MTVLVKMSNGDTEHFPAATHWAEILNGGLRVFIAAEPPVLVAEFPAGAWAAVLDPAPVVPVIDGSGLGKTFRRDSSGITVTTAPNPQTYTINLGGKAITHRSGPDPRDEPPAAARVPA